MEIVEELVWVPTCVRVGSSEEDSGLDCGAGVLITDSVVGTAVEDCGEEDD